MALLTYADRVAETTTTTGTGTIQLLGAVDAKFRTFVAGVGSGNTVPYVMVHRTANEWEVGYGVVTSGSPNTLTRAGIYASSNSGSAVSFSAGTKDVFLALPGSKTVRFDDATGGINIDNGTFVVDAANDLVGIGTANPTATFHVASNSGMYYTNTDFVANSVGSGVIIGTGATSGNTYGTIYGFEAGNTQYANLVIPGGNLGIGVTPSARLHVAGSPDGTYNAQLLLGNTGATNQKIAFLPTVSSGIGGIDDGSLVFFANGANTERARITAGGYFKASNAGTYDNATGTSHELRNSANDNVVTISNTSSATPYGVSVKFTAAAPDNNNEYFLLCSDTVAQRCIIYSDGDLANHDGVYGTISDERLKQDIVDASSQWDDLKAIRFRKYRMKSDVEANPDAPYLLGVVAQELEQTSPGLVDEHPNFEEQEVTDEDGNVTTEKVQVGTTKSVKSSILLMKAAKALQEAMARIEALEARLAALEGAA